ncbi:uncharacterized protein TNCV_385521 [Trichonephila clavipes]|nr:uncharacterized protein TNCV_385521 [Trichonephila clavipes]
MADMVTNSLSALLGLDITEDPLWRIIHHQESDLLWRLGLISPEAYKITTAGTRSAPSNQGAYMKTPSYDLTEEQLMANIEKEFECTI